jgi:hypothetical protein
MEAKKRTEIQEFSRFQTNAPKTARIPPSEKNYPAYTPRFEYKSTKKLTIPVSPKLRTNRTKAEPHFEPATKKQPLKPDTAIKQNKLVQPQQPTVRQSPRLALKRKHDHAATPFIKLKSPLKKTQKQFRGFKSPEPLNKSLLKKRSELKRKELDFQTNNEMETEIDESELLPEAMSSLSLEESAEDEMEEDAPIKKKPRTNTTATTTTAPKTQSLPVNHRQNLHFPVQKTARAPVVRKSIATATVNNNNSNLQKTTITKRALTVPHSPKLLTKRLR